MLTGYVFGVEKEGMGLFFWIFLWLFVWINMGLAKAEPLAITYKHTNRLIHQTSPYLVQHAHNPVDWYPWGAEALERASREQKLIFLSIGYAACHWCHVMERESFEDPATAAILNKYYISIKVDREERPDLDGHFMKVLTAMTGSGGWPLNMILTPDLKPVYGGTYFPLEASSGKPAFQQVLTALNDEWRGDRKKLDNQLQALSNWLDGELLESFADVGEKDVDYRSDVLKFWLNKIDTRLGGFGKGSKFPQPVILSFMMRQAVFEDNLQQIDAVFMTLDNMAAGGVRDQLGGAFHRYSVDPHWQVPHFEIMLYDNAQLASLYLDAYQLTKKSRYALVAREILDDLLVRFRQPGGCFISSLDADSEGEEGLFYTWTEAEIVSVLGKERARPFLELFFDPFEGVVEERTVLRLLSDPETLEDSLEEIKESRLLLLEARNRRVKPFRDDKILTSWNGLTVSAFAKASQVLNDTYYLKIAQACWKDLQDHSFKGGKLLHSRRGNRVGDRVFLDDYAFLIQGLLDLYESDFKVHHLDRARSLALEMLERFQSAPGKSLQLTAMDQPTAVPSQIVLEDGVIPAANSVALVSLQRLALYSQDPGLEKTVLEIQKGLAGYLQTRAASSPELLRVWDYQPQTAVEVIIVAPQGKDAREGMRLLKEVRNRFIPGLVVVWVDPTKSVDDKQWPLLSGRQMIEEKATAYVCRNRVCRLPVTDVPSLIKELQAW